MKKLQIAYEKLLEAIQEGIWVYDADLYTTYVNLKMAEIIGYEVEELIGRHLFDFLDEEGKENIERKVERRKLGISEVYEEKFKHKNGHYVYVELKATPIIDEKGKYNGGIAGINDISESKEAEQKLRESEARKRAILNALPDIMFICNNKGIFLDYHANDKSLLAVEPSQFLGKSVMDVLPAEVASQFVQGFEQAYETSRLQIFDYLLNVPDGLRHFEARITPMDDQRLLAIVQEVTDRKQAEEELKFQSEILDSIGDLVTATDPDGRILYVNEAECRKFGKARDELIGKTTDIFGENPELGALQKEIVETTNEKGFWRGEVVNYDKDNNPLYLDCRTWVMRDTDGSIQTLIGVSTDITERKQVEEALRKNEQELRTITETMTDVVAMADIEGKFTYISKSNYQLTGYKPSELIGKSIFELIHKEDIATVGAKFQKSIVENEKETRAEYRIRNKNGSYTWVETIGSLVIGDDEKPSGAIFVSRDITDRKKAEEKILYIGFHDQLTALYNRHYFESCKEELKGIPLLSVIMTDINGLKLINDTYGHQAGDELLKNYAELLRKSFKQSDLIIRWGGDEFIIILKNTKEAVSWELCNRLIRHCGETFVKDIPLSISVGISSKLQGGDIDKAIQEAEDMMYKNKLTESKSSKNLIIKTLLQTLSEKSFETKGHIDRMTMVGRQFGERLGLLPSELSRLEALALLHDIGKINIDGRILLKETALSAEEWEEIKKHSEVGYRITRTTEEFAYIAEEILSHHERWDGNGYPQGLAGEKIPYLSRLLNIIDSYDVMSNGRPYKKKMTSDEIIEEFKRCSGKQFDPYLAEEFVEFMKDGKFEICQ